MADHSALVTILALAGLSLLAYAIGALDFLGAVASFFLGLLIAQLADLRWLALMVAFTGLSVVATRIGYARKQELGIAEGLRGERGLPNVMGNGAAAGLTVLATQMPEVPPLAVQLAFATAVAAVTADTLASEVGSLAGRARSILPPFRPVARGANGGVSWLGQAAAAIGAGLIAALAVWAVGVPTSLAWVPLLGGFLGCQLDSVLGAALEHDGPAPRGRRRPLGKQDVNFLASAAPAVVVLAAWSWMR